MLCRISDTAQAGAMPGAAPFHDLSQEELRELLLGVRLYAQWRLPPASHRETGLDPQELALRAVSDTLDGTARFEAERTDLLRHLISCIDSHAGHRQAPAEVRRQAPQAAPVRAAGQVHAGDGDPEALADIPPDELDRELERELERLGVDTGDDLDALMRVLDPEAGNGMHDGAGTPPAQQDGGHLAQMPLAAVEDELRAAGVDLNEWLTRAQVLIRGRGTVAAAGGVPGGGSALPGGLPRDRSSRRWSRWRLRRVAAALVTATVVGVALMTSWETGVLDDLTPRATGSLPGVVVEEEPRARGRLEERLERRLEVGDRLGQVLDELPIDERDRNELLRLLGEGPLAVAARLDLVMAGGRVRSATLTPLEGQVLRIRRSPAGELVRLPR